MNDREKLAALLAKIGADAAMTSRELAWLVAEASILRVDLDAAEAALKPFADALKVQLLVQKPHPFDHESVLISLTRNPAKEYFTCKSERRADVKR